MTELLHPDCVPPDQNVVFGYNLAHTSKPNTRAFIEHWIALGFLEFRKIWRNGAMRDPLPVGERWHMLRDDDNASDSGDVRFHDEIPDAADNGLVLLHQSKAPIFGSKGRILELVVDDPAGFIEPIHDVELPVLEDPGDAGPRPMPAQDPRDPIWTPPCVVPNTSWARGQFVSQFVREVRGGEMQAVQSACLALVRCPVRFDPPRLSILQLQTKGC